MIEFSRIELGMMFASLSVIAVSICYLLTVIQRGPARLPAVEPVAYLWESYVLVVVSGEQRTVHFGNILAHLLSREWNARAEVLRLYRDKPMDLQRYLASGFLPLLIMRFELVESQINPLFGCQGYAMKFSLYLYNGEYVGLYYCPDCAHVHSDMRLALSKFDEQLSLWQRRHPTQSLRALLPTVSGDGSSDVRQKGYQSRALSFPG